MRRLSNPSIALFTVDTCVLRCYKTQKDKLFGGESPNELHKAVASEAADLPGRAGLLSRRGYCHATPTTPGGENEPVFTSFLFFGGKHRHRFKMKHSRLRHGLGDCRFRRFLGLLLPLFPCARLCSVKMTLSFPPVIAGCLPLLTPQ